MPFWNEGKFLREAIESVLAQTYDTWQLFLVDDGSIDTSTSIALWYAEHWPQKVRYLEHRGHGNLGASAARNLGISQAEGSYIAFLDADDVWLPRTLEEQVAILDSHPEAGMVYGATEWWYSWAGNPEDGAIDRIPDLGVAPNTLLRPPILLTLMLQDSIAVPWLQATLMVRRDLAQAVGGFEDSIRRVFTDQAFYAKLLLRASAFVSGECWGRYRQHADSSCSLAKRRGERNSARLYYLRWLKRYLSEERITNPEVWRALRLKWRRHHRPFIFKLIRRLRSHFNPGRTVRGL